MPHRYGNDLLTRLNVVVLSVSCTVLIRPYTLQYSEKPYIYVIKNTFEGGFSVGQAGGKISLLLLQAFGNGRPI